MYIISLSLSLYIHIYVYIHLYTHTYIIGEADLKEHEELTKVKNVNKIQFGKYVLDTWYFSPLPREIWKAGDDVIPHLYMCEFTLNFYKVGGVPAPARLGRMCGWVRVHGCKRTRAHAHTRARTHTGTHTLSVSPTHTHQHTHAHARTRTHTHAPTHTHPPTHTHLPTQTKAEMDRPPTHTHMCAYL